MPQKILVTGADGFIGSHLVEHLVTAGHAVRAFVLYNSFGSAGWLDAIDGDALKGVDVFPGDIRDPGRVKAAVAGCDRVLHLAALISIPYSYLAPHSFTDTNVGGTENVLVAARDAGVAKVVIASTSEVYGTAQAVPITEAHPLNAQSPYAASKIAADQLALSFHRSFELPLTIVRPFNTYGPRQSTRAVLPTVITQLARGERRLKLGAIHPTRDFSYVGDTAAGFALAADPAKAVGEVVNLGSDFEVSIGEAARMIGEILGVEPEFTVDPARLRPGASEVERLWADNAKAARLLGWSPAYGGREGFRRGLERTIAWFRDPAYLKLYRPDRYQV